VTRAYDVVVIGTGQAGTGVADACRKAGRQVAIVDSRPYGGTCGLRGCDPKKVLMGAADLADWASRMSANGITGGPVRIDWQALMRFKRTFTDPFPKAREDALRSAGIETLHGRARFVSGNAIQVDDDVLEARHVVIAAGAWPAPLNIPGEEHLTRSDQFLELEELPKRIVFAGGGYIAFEFSHIAARAGAQVTILHRGARPLEKFDPDLVQKLVERTRGIGVDMRLKTKVTGVEGAPGRLAVSTETESGPESFEADMVVHAAGRAPEIADLNLDAAGVQFDSRGVKVNKYLQSVSNPAVYAAGDAADSGGFPNTPEAEYSADIAARNLLEGNKHAVDFRGSASVVFTIPPLARIGLLEEEAKREGLKYKVNQADISGWYSARRVAEPCAAFKVLLEEGSRRLLGAHLVGPGADELANVFVLALRAEVPAPVLKEALFAYPTQAANIKWMLS
jgi:glutathione reductase (NADPH)